MAVYHFKQERKDGELKNRRCFINIKLKIKYMYN